MCLAVYVASDALLPESRWNEQAPAFYLEAVPKSEDVCTHFRYRHVYYAGSHEGCGCGFSKDGRDIEELQRCQANYLALASALSNALLNGTRVQLYTCWEGEQTNRPESTGAVTVNELTEPEFELQQLSLLSVRRGA